LAAVFARQWCKLKDFTRQSDPAWTAGDKPGSRQANPARGDPLRPAGLRPPRQASLCGFPRLNIDPQNG
jgi:hypothetical protein